MQDHHFSTNPLSGNHFSALLSVWCQGQKGSEWVLGTVYKTEGSAYRKAGAMMLMNDLGKQYGLLSGGCLEADILRHAARVIVTKKSMVLIYDAKDEDDWSYQLGIGCGGKVYIQLQYVGDELRAALLALQSALQTDLSGAFFQQIGSNRAYFEPSEVDLPSRSYLQKRADGLWLVSPMIPVPHIAVIGGGADAKPVVNIAKMLGWRVTLVDSRTGYGRRAEFQKADYILSDFGSILSQHIERRRVRAAIVMSHNLRMDAEGLRCCRGLNLEYLALLGPRHRYQQVMVLAGLDEKDLSAPISAPAGFNIGGELPESIALSILSECHAALFTGVKKGAKNGRDKGGSENGSANGGANGGESYGIRYDVELSNRLSIVNHLVE